MTYIKWECGCGKIFISNSNRHHEMDACDTCGSFLDAEEYYFRVGGNYMFIKSFNYNFFDELVLCMKEQGFEVPIRPFEDFENFPYYYYDYSFIRKLEDEMCEELK
jgi:hypothetical protein